MESKKETIQSDVGAELAPNARIERQSETHDVQLQSQPKVQAQSHVSDSAMSEQHIAKKDCGLNVAASHTDVDALRVDSKTTIFEGSPYLDSEKKRKKTKQLGDLTLTLSPLRRAWLLLSVLLAFLALVFAPIQFDSFNLGAEYLNVSKQEVQTPLNNSQQAIFEDARSATLQIEVLGPSLAYRYVQGMGTGFFISEDGLVLTAYHVIRSHKDSRFVAKDIMGRRYLLELVAFDAHQDVALLRADLSSKVSYLRLGSVQPRVGSQVMSIGNSRGDFLQARAGRVKRLNAKASRADFASDTIEFSAKLEAGDSGGPVLNSKGEVIGIVSYISFIPDDVLQQSKKLIPSPLRPLLLPPQISSFAVPMFRNSVILKELLAGKKRDVPVIGIYGSDYVPGNAIDNLGSLAGALVDHVPEGSPAFFSGLKSCQLKDSVLQQAGLNQAGANQAPQSAQVVGCMAVLGNSSAARGSRDAGNLRSQAAIQSADVIIAIDGERTNNFVEVINKIRAYNIGDEVVLTVQRGSEVIELVLLLGAEAHIFDQRF